MIHKKKKHKFFCEDKHFKISNIFFMVSHFFPLLETKHLFLWPEGKNVACLSEKSQSARRLQAANTANAVM